MSYRYIVFSYLNPHQLVMFLVITTNVRINPVHTPITVSPVHQDKLGKSQEKLNYLEIRNEINQNKTVGVGNIISTLSSLAKRERADSITVSSV